MSLSKLRAGLCLCVIVATSIVTETASGDSWLAVSADGIVTIQDISAAKPPVLDVRAYDENGIELAVTTTGLAFAPRTTKGGDFVQIMWPDRPVTGEIGTPALPVIRRLFTAPAAADVLITIDQGQTVVIDARSASLPLRVMPVQPPIPKLPGARARAEFVLDEASYGVDRGLLAERAVVEELGIVRGQRLFLLEARPVDYNPVAQTLTVWPEIGIGIHFDGGNQSAGGLLPLPGLHHILLNPSPAAGAGRGTGNYLIVVASTFETDIASYAAAKAAQGFTVTTHSVAPGTSNSTIKSYIQGLWGDPGTAPDYVLLVGDTDRIPHWTGGGAGSPATDLQYGSMDGSADWYPDIAIGRFPVDTPAELQTMIDKTLYYENGPLADPAYKKRAVFMASVDNYQISEGTHEYVINTYLEPFGYQVDRLYQVTYGATTQDVTDSFNDGRFYGIYSGHGGEYSWADGPPFSQSNVNALTNENMYAMICSFACVTGTYTLDECFMETWVLAPNKGAVTAWGSSVTSYWDEDDILERRLFDAIFDNEDDVKTEIGPIYNEAKIRHLAYYGPTSTTRRYFEMYNLMGDPALPLPSGCSDAGEIAIDRTAYACESTVQIEVMDCGLNVNDNVIDTVEVMVQSESEPAGESVTLYETDTASSQFNGTITLSQTDEAGVLLVAEGDTVVATYVDADDGQGGQNVEVIVSAGIDCQAPGISNIQVSDIQPRSATVTFDADEPVIGIVHYGPGCDALTQQASSSVYAGSVVVNLTGLNHSTAYYFTVEAEDEAGNASGDDTCYSFVTPEVPDFFAEQFTGDFDLANLSVFFTPNGSDDFYAGCTEQIAAFPTDPTGGTTLSFSPSNDDGYANVFLSGGETVSLYGTGYTNFFVGSNGYITFGAGDSGYDETFADHFDLPRVSGCLNDLSPGPVGTVSWKQLPDRVAVTWDNVPEYNTANSNNFQIELFFNGDIRISYLQMDAGDGIAGLSAGDGVDPDFIESDLSALLVCAERPPTAFSVELETPGDTPVMVTLNASDDGLPDPPGMLTYVVLSLPTYGTLNDPGTGPIESVPYALPDGDNQVEYVPLSWFRGGDTFEFKANDGGVPPDGGDSNTAAVSITVGGPESVFFFPLDTDPGWTREGQWEFGVPQGGGSSNGDPTGGFTGSNVFGYNLAGDYSNNLPPTYLTTTPIDCSNVTGTELRFQRWLGVEGATYDHASVEVSNDGTNWTTIWDHTGGTTSDGSWSLQIFDVSDVADGQPEVYIRWVMGPTDYVFGYPGWNIDDIDIWGITAPADCNGNEIPDSQDILDGTSEDCNLNNVPDECESDPQILSQPTSELACYGGSVTFTVTAEGFGALTYQWRKDGVDIDGETQASCTIDSVDDETVGDYDVVVNGDCGSVTSDAATLSTLPVPATVQPDPTAPDVGNGTKNRYLSFIAGEAGSEQAIHVTLASVPGSPYAEGRTMWVQEPHPITEASGSAAPTPEPTHMAASLGCQPFYTDWAALGVIDVYDDAVVPGGSYEIRVIDALCDPARGESYSPQLDVALAAPGDVVGDCADCPCTAPNGVIDFVDISAVVEKFKNTPCTPGGPGVPRKAEADLINSTTTLPKPDHVVDFVDISYCVDAFRGEAAPLPGPPLDDPCTP